MTFYPSTLTGVVISEISTCLSSAHFNLFTFYHMIYLVSYN